MTRTTVNVLDCPIDVLDMEETVSSCREAIVSRDWHQHVCINAAKLVRLRRDPRLAGIVRDAALVSADGQSVVWASRLLGRPVPERVAGIDLMQHLLELAEREGFGVFVLGAQPEVLEQALERFAADFPCLRFVGHHHGYFADDEVPALCDEIRAAQPDILLVAMSTPKKEYWLAEHGPGLGVPFAMGVGGALDVVAGVTRRAPRWVQRAGLEWFFRLLQEPRRLASRYLVTNTVFLLLLLRELLRGDPAAPPERARIPTGEVVGRE